MRPIDADELLKSGFFSNETIPERILFAGDVESMPTIDPIQHGRWIFTFICGEDPYQCSVCGNTVNVTGLCYCPSCGAKMDEVKE